MRSLDTMLKIELAQEAGMTHIEYANLVWSPYLMKHITALETVQLRATKLIPGYKELDYKERLKRLKSTNSFIPSS